MEPVLHAIAAALLLRIGLSDWQRRRIANADVLALAAVVALATALSPPPAITLAGSCAVALALTLPGFLAGRVGGGDVKLLCALAPLWSGLELLAIFAGGVAATTAALLVPTGRPAGGAIAAAPSLPLGTAVSGGALVFLAWRLAAHV